MIVFSSLRHHLFYNRWIILKIFGAKLKNLDYEASFYADSINRKRLLRAYGKTIMLSSNTVDDCMGIGDNFLFISAYTTAIDDGYILDTDKTQNVMNVVGDIIDIAA